MKHFRIALLAIAVALASCTPQQPAKVSALMQYEDTINSLIAQMTLEEKVNMLHGKTMFSSAGVERLGIADMIYADGPFGIREELEDHSWTPLGLSTDSATFFPTGSALAATWCPGMGYDYGKGMATEARLRGKDMILGPAMNIQRIPTGGRTYEYLSEDPKLTSVMAIAYTNGAQENGAAVCLKHFAVNNQENHRGFYDAQLSKRALHEIYLKAFEDAVRDADAFGVMSAYNKVDGFWCAENEYLLDEVLRKTWGFKGMVISDWGGTHSTVGSVTSGLNVEMPGNTYLGEALLDSVKAGIVPEEVIDQRVREILRVRFAIPAVPKEQANKEITSKPEQQQIAYTVATRSVVMLKNETHLLPLDLDKYKKIAVIGDNATCTQALGGIGAGVKALYEITPLQGLLDRIGDKAEVKYAQGYQRYTLMDMFSRKPIPTEPDAKLMNEAVKLAKESDLVIFVAGENRNIETEGSDRASITLPLGQDQLAEALAAANPNIITVLVVGAPVDLRVIDKVSPSIVVSWYNGTEGGHALADIMTGKISPSGKLPFTFPMKLEDSPAYALGAYPQQMSQEQQDVFVNLVNRGARQRAMQLKAEYPEGILVGYRWYEANNIPVMFPFGHGLSYTTFEYSNLQTEVTQEGIKVTFQLKNTGEMDAMEIPQVYVSRPDSKIQRPLKELKGFKRTGLKAGEEKTIEILLKRHDLSHWDETANEWQLEPGAVKVLVGSSSQDIKLEQSTQI